MDSGLSLRTSNSRISSIDIACFAQHSSEGLILCLCPALHISLTSYSTRNQSFSSITHELRHHGLGQAPLELRSLAANILLSIWEGVLHIVVRGLKTLVIRLLHNTLKWHSVTNELNDTAVPETHELLGRRPLQCLSHPPPPRRRHVQVHLLRTWL